MSYVWNRQSIELSLDMPLSLSVSTSSSEITISSLRFSPFGYAKNCNCQLLDATSLFIVAHSLNIFSTLLFLPRVCWPIISTFLSCFDCFLVAELSPLASRSSYCSQEVNRHILLLPARMSMLSSPAADCQLRFCFVFCFLLCSVLRPKMRHTLWRATVRLWLLCFNWNVFATAAGISAAVTAAGCGLCHEEEQGRPEHSTTAKRIRTSS